jgi:colanic acid biosynthesis glycosyl transferase WcaI
VKIIFVNRFYAPDHSATSQMLTDLAEALVIAGLEIHVITSRLRYDDPKALLSAREKIAGVDVHRIHTSTFGRHNLVGRAFDYLSFYVVASVRLHGLVRRRDVVVIKTDPPLISIPLGWVARIRGARSVNWLQDVFPEVAAELGVGMARGIVGKLLRWLRNRSFRAANVNVVLGGRMRTHLEQSGVPADIIAEIANWADGEAIKPLAPALNPLRAEFGLKSKFVVCYSGNMGRAHEFRTIVDAVSELQHETDIAFLFIGGGAQKAMVAEVSTERGLANLVFKPYQPRERLQESLGVADVHLVTLRPEMEGLIVPSKFYGIAAAGRPTIFIGDADGEIGSEVRSSDAGVCVEQGDVAGLVTAVRTMRTDHGARERMGGNARKAFEERYAKPLQTGKWRELLLAVADTGHLR